MKISLIIPAYNEEKRISKTIVDYIDFLNIYDYEIIVVCDGIDNTNNIIRNFMKTNSNIKLLESRVRRGKGRAIVQGFKESNGDIIGFVDADNSVPPREFKKLLIFMCENDCVIGSRIYNGNTIVNRNIKRKIPSKIFNIIVNILFGLKINDTQCGGKLFKKKVIDSVSIDKFNANGFEFDVELLWRIKNKGFKIKEVPINWEDTKGTTFSLKFSLNMLVSLLKIRMNII